MSGLRCCVVIPALNEARTIRAVAEGCLRHFPDVVVVDDGSSDGTAACLDGLSVEVLRHPAPLGKARALVDGFRWALEHRFDAVLTLDGDGQHDAADLPRLAAVAERFPDHIVIGARLLARERQPRHRRFGNAFADWWVAWPCGQRIADTQSGQRCYPRRVLELALDMRQQGFVFETAILIEAADRGIATISVPIAARYEPGARASHFRPLRDVSRITRLIAWRLIRGGLRLGHLWRALRSRPRIVEI